MNKDDEHPSFYKQYPKTCAPDDFWGQVKRTVNGEPISQDQVDMIVEAVTDGLDLGFDDQLLDLCCGNGALTTMFFAKCGAGIGVDYSEYLIEVARQNFLKPKQKFMLQDVNAFVRNCTTPELYTKVLCYGALQYLPREEAGELLIGLADRFANVARVFIGNVPDKSKIHEFFGERYEAGIEDDPDAPIGVWWQTDEFREMAQGTGWDVEIRRMPSAYFTAYYRFDAVLFPKAD